jgi:3-deoxy-D-manno-octulosonic-acid transferase
MGFSILCYNVGLFLALCFLSPVWLLGLCFVPKTRAGFAQKLGFYTADTKAQFNRSASQRPRIWFHAVSVGEFNAIRPLLSAKMEQYDLVISTTTQTGQELAKKTYPDLRVFYFPFDLRPCIGSALDLVQPDLVVIAETELWPNFIDLVLHRAKKPLIFINGRLSQRSLRGYRWIQAIISPTLRRVSHWYMQSQADAERLRLLANIDPEQMTVAGNLKFDLAPHVNSQQQEQLKNLLNFNEHHSVLVFASTHSGEESPLLDVYQHLRRDFPELKLIIAPRHPERLAAIKTLLNSLALSYSVRSQLSLAEPNQNPIIVLDTIGELLSIYSLATVAVMGGSFVDKGGQNPLEPISQRVPVLFGPHMENFAEIAHLICEANAGSQVQTMHELMHEITVLLTQPEQYDTIAETGLQLLENNRGARPMLLHAIDQILVAESQQLCQTR